MYQSLKIALNSWNDSTTDRQKLQHTYIAVAVALLIVAGVLGLINQPLGQQILAIAIAAAVVFLVNAVIWALLQSFVLLRVTITPKPVSRPAAATTPRKK
jgi:tellurite resistance protein TehA-like permease